MLVIGQCNRTVKGQLTCRACVSGQNTSCMCAVVSHFIELTVFCFFFLMEAYNWSSFFLKFCHSFD